MKKSHTTSARRLPLGLVLGVMALGAFDAQAQIAPPPAPPAPPARPAPPAPALRFEWTGGLDLDLDFDLDLPLPPLPPLPPVAALLPPLPPMPPMPPLQLQAPRAVQRGEADGQELYEQAQRSINQGRYERAVEQLDRLIARFEGQPSATAVANRVDGALYWKAYTLIKQKQIADALSTLDVIQKKFPASRWMKDAKALEVEARQASGQAVAPEAQADEELKLLALRGLMQSDPDRAVPMIEQLLAGNSSVRVKENALFVLSQSRSARAREIITAVAKGSGNPDLQLRAVRYLGAMGGSENRQVLDDVYRSATDAAVKRAVIRSLVPSGDRARLLAIAKSESSPELRSEAIQQLGAMRAVNELSDLYGGETSVDVKRRIIQSLMVSQAADRLLELARAEKDEQLRRIAVRNLGVMSPERTGEALRGLYKSEPNPAVKAEIVNALFVQRNAAALVDLARAEKDRALQRDIVAKLSNMRERIAADYLLELLK